MNAKTLRYLSGTHIIMQAKSPARGKKTASLWISKSNINSKPSLEQQLHLFLDC